MNPFRLRLSAPLALALLLGGCATGVRIDTSQTSLNQDSRAQFLVLHYTVGSFESALKTLTTGGQVSSHYLVRDNPVRTYRLVDESRRAWHAGISSWHGSANLNAASIGIEIVNPGLIDTPEGRRYAPYPEAQILEVMALVREIAERHGIRPDRIVGHSDIQPQNKTDPGPQFPWKRLADAGLIPWPDPAQVAVRLPLFEALNPGIAWAQDKLFRHGFAGVPRSGELDTLTRKCLAAFQMKYRPAKYDGELDAETAALLEVATLPGGMVMAPPDPKLREYRSSW